MPGAGPAAPHVCRLPLPPPAPGGSRHFPSGLRGGGSQVDTATPQPPARPSRTGSGCWTGSRVPGARGQARAADGAPPGLGLQTSGSDPSVSHDVRGAGGGQEFFFFNETEEKRKKSVRVHAGTWSFRGPLFSTFLGRPRAVTHSPRASWRPRVRRNREWLRLRGCPGQSTGRVPFCGRTRKGSSWRL